MKPKKPKTQEEKDRDWRARNPHDWRAPEHCRLTADCQRSYRPIYDKRGVEVLLNAGEFFPRAPECIRAQRETERKLGRPRLA